MNGNPEQSLTFVRPLRVVVSGSYKKQVLDLKRDYEMLLDLGFEILSPSSVDFTKEEEGFVYTSDDVSSSPRQIELRHLQAIRQCDFVWLHVPEGYVGQSGALEIGFAFELGIPIFAREIPTDVTLRAFVTQVAHPSALANLVHRSDTRPGEIAPADWLIQGENVFGPLRAMQRYYSDAALRRGYERESLKDAMILITEEIGELAKAIRKSEDLPRHGDPIDKAVGTELADVFLYVLHIANIAGIDFDRVVLDKEKVNEDRARKESPGVKGC